jgi:hypothetical protein
MDERVQCHIGLDISTKCTGVVALTLEGDLLFREHLPFKQTIDELSLYARADMVRRYFREIKNGVKPVSITVEEAARGFSKGFTTGHTMASLNTFNAFIRLICWEEFSIEPKLESVSHVRKVVLGSSAPQKIGRKAGRERAAAKRDVKQAVLDWATTQFEGFEYAKNGRGNTPPHMFDEADAALMAYYGYLQSL